MRQFLANLVLCSLLFTLCVPAVQAADIEKILRSFDQDMRLETRIEVRAYEKLEELGLTVDIFSVTNSEGIQNSGSSHHTIQTSNEITVTTKDQEFTTTSDYAFDAFTKGKLNIYKLLGYEYHAGHQSHYISEKVEKFWNDLIENEKYFRLVTPQEAEETPIMYVLNNLPQFISLVYESGLVSLSTTTENNQEIITLTMSPKLDKKNIEAAKALIRFLIAKAGESDAASEIRNVLVTRSDDELVEIYESVMSDITEDEPLFKGTVVLERGRPVMIQFHLNAYLLGFQNYLSLFASMKYQRTPKISLPDTSIGVRQGYFLLPFANLDPQILNLDELAEADETTIEQYYLKITQSCAKKTCANRELRKIQKQINRKDLIKLRKLLNTFYEQNIGVPII